MSESSSPLSNPFSTGGGGHNFEVHVEAAFAVLMLAGGFAPCLPLWPIVKIKLQGKYAGYATDDFIAFARVPGGDRQSKLLAQIKHAVALTTSDTTFGEVIAAAWSDFSNRTLFDPEGDAIALVTGPLGAVDSENTRTILEWARTSSDAEEFITKVELAKFSSATKREKLAAFRFHLNRANGKAVSDDELWRFLRCFHLLGYDLDIRAGLTLSLLHSLIGQYSPEAVGETWALLIDEVQYANQSAGTLTVDRMSQDIQGAFRQPARVVIPQQLAPSSPAAGTPAVNQWHSTQGLAVAVLVGSWDEASHADKLVTESLSDGKYAHWIAQMREALLQPASPLELSNGKWRLTGRLEVWQALGHLIFDEHLDRFLRVAVSVLLERDPRFDMPPEDRFAAPIYGKVLLHSSSVRKGLAETLALLGSHPEALTSCSAGRPVSIAVAAVRQILANADWLQWAGLNDVLPLLAEAAPGEFLDAVETALSAEPCPFDMVFAQERAPLIGGTYITGLLWALETLAWDADYLTRVTMALGQLAARDPGGMWTNRPANSLTTILLPWLPQTCASVAKRKTAVSTLLNELPGVAWNLLLTLLPNVRQTSGGSHRPTWRGTIPHHCGKGTAPSEYWEQVGAYAELAIGAANSDLDKLAQLLTYIPSLPPPEREQLIAELGSEQVRSMPESERLPLWASLVSLISHHRKYADAKWALSKEQVDRVAALARQLAPQAPELHHRRLFSTSDHDLFEERGNYAEQEKKLAESRQTAVQEIAASGGVQAVVAFARSVGSPRRVGIAYGLVESDEADDALLPSLLETEDTSPGEFLAGFVSSRFHACGWPWADGLDMSGWTPAHVGQFLAYLPFTPDTWARSARLLVTDESPYWTKTTANPYDSPGDLAVAVDQLLAHGRPYDAIHCLSVMQHAKQSLDARRTLRALRAALGPPRPPDSSDERRIANMIGALQDDPRIDLRDVSQLEWQYLPLLEEPREVYPKLLERQLANQPEFFCEVTRLAFRSSKVEAPIEEPTEQARMMAANAYRLLDNWRTPPGSQEDGALDGEALSAWLGAVKKDCGETGHLEVAMIMVGHVLIHAPSDPDGLWIHHAAAATLNAPDAAHMRNGFSTGLANSRGIYTFTGGREEREIASSYRQRAEAVDAAGYYRLATTLRDLAASYEHDAEQQASRNPFEG